MRRGPAWTGCKAWHCAASWVPGVHLQPAAPAQVLLTCMKKVCATLSFQASCSLQNSALCRNRCSSALYAPRSQNTEPMAISTAAAGCTNMEQQWGQYAVSPFVKQKNVRCIRLLLAHECRHAAKAYWHAIHAHSMCPQGWLLDNINVPAASACSRTVLCFINA